MAKRTSRDDDHAAEAASAPAPNRMTRQRQRTRDRLVNAAMAVISRKGVDSTTIQEITETADLGFGSFYNHFSSKDDIVKEAINELYERIGRQIDMAISAIADPLEAMTMGIRLFVAMTSDRKEIGQFLIRVCMVPEFKEIGLFPRLFRDVRSAQLTGRIKVVDQEAAYHALGGAMIFLCQAMHEANSGIGEAHDRIAAMALRILGVSEGEVAHLIAMPCPKDLQVGLIAS